MRGDSARLALRLLRGVIADADRVVVDAAHAYVFCDWQTHQDFADAVAVAWRPTNLLVWHKDRGGVGDCIADWARDYELIIHAQRGRRPLSGRRDGAVLQGWPPPAWTNRAHPTQKPVGLLGYLIDKSTTPGDTILDPFAGSGSTLVAAAEAGRRAIGVEIDADHCAAAARRIDAALDEAAAAA